MRKSKTSRKSPEKWTFLSLAFYNAPSLHTVNDFCRINQCLNGLLMLECVPARKDYIHKFCVIELISCNFTVQWMLVSLTSLSVY